MPRRGPDPVQVANPQHRATLAELRAARIEFCYQSYLPLLRRAEGAAVAAAGSDGQETIRARYNIEAAEGEGGGGGLEIPVRDRAIESRRPSSLEAAATKRPRRASPRSIFALAPVSAFGFRSFVRSFVRA